MFFIIQKKKNKPLKTKGLFLNKANYLYKKIQLLYVNSINKYKYHFMKTNKKIFSYCYLIYKKTGEKNTKKHKIIVIFRLFKIYLPQ